jgi:hypothetical protein
VILSVRLFSGHFESSIQMPLDATEKERDEFVMAWLELMRAGIKIGLSKKKPPPTT